MSEPAGVATIWVALPEARLVGGVVRDELAGETIADYDFASPLPPEEVMTRLRAAGIKAVPTGLAHGTVTAVCHGRGFEITTLRRDVTADGRHAEVAFTDDWRADAARRDFTFNAMSKSRGDEIFDYFGGQADLAAGCVRFVGVAAARVQEDFLRILRFFRFYARYGRGHPDEEAVAAITLLKDGLSRLSVERIWIELKGLLRTNDPAAALTVMAETGVLPLLVPGAAVEELMALLAREAPADPLLRLAALLPDDQAASAFGVANKLSQAEQERLVALRRPMTLAPGADDAALRRALADEPADLLVARSWLATGDDQDMLRHRIVAEPRPEFPLRGRDLMALGDDEGPEMGAKLAAARDWWWQSGCTADVAACLAYLQTL